MKGIALVLALARAAVAAALPVAAADGPVKAAPIVVNCPVL